MSRISSALAIRALVWLLAWDSPDGVVPIQGIAHNRYRGICRQLCICPLLNIENIWSLSIRTLYTTVYVIIFLPCNSLLSDSLSFSLFLVFIPYDAIDDGCISNVSGNCIKVSSKSKIQVWPISMCLLETERQSKAIVLDKKWEIKTSFWMNRLIDMSLKGRWSVGSHQWSFHICILLVDFLFNIECSWMFWWKEKICLTVPNHFLYYLNVWNLIWITVCILKIIFNDIFNCVNLQWHIYSISLCL